MTESDQPLTPKPNQSSETFPEFLPSAALPVPPENAPAESVVLPTEQSAEPYDQMELIQEIKDTADKLVRDQATRGDLKILSRALRELRYAFKVFKPLRPRRKVTVFGSARTPPEHPSFQAAVEFGRAMAAEGWMVMTGAGSGIMEAGHIGAGKAMSIGVNIMLPFEQDANPVINHDEKLIHLKYFFTRKLLFVKEVHAVAVFEGGFGTQDEIFETVTLVQTGKRDLMPIVCVDQPGGTYWSAWKQFIEEQLLDKHWISPADMSLFRITDNVEEAVQEILGFYRVYHSMRYVRKKLVVRLQREISDELLAKLNCDFADISSGGQIERTGPLPQESDDPHLAALPRLIFQFDRRNIGRLRQMVDAINASPN